VVRKKKEKGRWPRNRKGLHPKDKAKAKIAGINKKEDMGKKGGRDK